jgi:hypothetical protein
MTGDELARQYDRDNLNLMIQRLGGNPKDYELVPDLFVARFIIAKKARLQSLPLPQPRCA